MLDAAAEILLERRRDKEGFNARSGARKIGMAVQARDENSGESCRANRIACRHHGVGQKPGFPRGSRHQDAPADGQPRGNVGGIEGNGSHDDYSASPYFTYLWKSGARFSWKARMPSFDSSVW